MKNNILFIVLVIVAILFKWLQNVVDIYNIIKFLLNQTYLLISEMNRTPRQMYTFRPYELTKVNYKGYKERFQQGINTYPKARSGHRIVCNDSSIYCFGGFNPDLAEVLQSRPARRRTAYLFQELWRYDLITKRWSLVFGPYTKDMPDEVASNAIILQDDIILVFGGTGYPFGLACSNKCYFFWPCKSPKAISLLDTFGDKPAPQYGQAIVLKDRYLYVVGGTSGFDYTCDIYRLDLITKEWECICICREDIREDPKGRYRHEVAYDDNYIYVLGGGTSETAYSLEELPAFGFANSKWTYIKTKPDPNAKAPGYPESRKCHSCIQYKTDNGIEVVIAGGYLNETKHYSDIWKLNLQTFQWRLFTTCTFPNPLYFHDAATSGNGLMYIFGGIEVRNGSNPRTNEVYKMWVTVPKLSEICWDAILHYEPKLSRYSRDVLLKMGIPLKFVNRIAQTPQCSAF